MDPKTIQSLLARYTARIKAPEKSVLDAFRTAVREELSIDVADDPVSYKPYERAIVLSFGGPKKAEILIAKSRVLSRLRTLLPAQSAPTDIR